MGAFVGVLMLVGVVALILAAGGSGYDVLAEHLPGAARPLVAVGMIGVLAGVAFKAGAVPVHFWLPDVSAGTSPAMAGFITTVPKLGAVAAAYRLLAEPFAEAGLNVALVVAVVSALSMTLGNLAAFQQSEVLRLLGYSSVSQVGYMFMVVAVAGRSDLAVPALAAYLAGYAVTNVGAFAAAAALPQAQSLEAWAQAARGRPWLVASLVVLLLGLVGTPPAAIFVGKLTVFAAAADGGFAWLMVLAAANTVASLFYYLRWFGPAARATARPRDRRGQTPASVAIAPMAATYVTAVASLAVGVGAGLWLALVAG